MQTIDSRWTMLDAFELSRIGARCVSAQIKLRASYGQASGPGLRIDTQCDAQALSFWVPEADWCAWLAPELAVPAFAALEPSWQSLAAHWTLVALNQVLQTQGLAVCGAAQIYPAPAPDVPGWQWSLQADTRRLPLFLVDAPAPWQQALLSSLEPDSQQLHTLGLSIGGCVLQKSAWSAVAVGDALRLDSVGQDLSDFWLHPARSPGQLRIMPDGLAHVVSKAVSAPPLSDAVLCIAVEAGTATLPATALADWTPGKTMSVQYARYPQLRLVAQGELLALGRLIRLDDAWLVQIEAMA